MRHDPDRSTSMPTKVPMIQSPERGHWANINIPRMKVIRPLKNTHPHVAKRIKREEIILKSPPIKQRTAIKKVTSIAAIVGLNIHNSPETP